MLPNWLYGKSKSKLASILGGGGGTPADYNQVKAQVTQNTDDIELLSDALDGKAALTQISNPNLLDNPWFTVNQRGASSYSDTTYHSEGKYIFDRWNLVTDVGGGSIAKNSNNIVFTKESGSNYVLLRQKLEDYSFLEDKALTMSVLLSDGTVHKGTAAFVNSSTNINFYIDSDLTLRFNDGYFQIVCKVATISIHAVKLELGSVSTLAMDIAPEYATELAKCQRYFQRIGPMQYENIGSGIIKSSQIATCIINIQPLRKDLKAVGDISLHGTVYIWNGTHFDGAGDQSTSLNGFAIGKDGHGTIDFNSTGLTVSSPAAFQFRDATSYIDFNAEL